MKKCLVIFYWLVAMGSYAQGQGGATSVLESELARYLNEDSRQGWLSFRPDFALTPEILFKEYGAVLGIAEGAVMRLENSVVDEFDLLHETYREYYHDILVEHQVYKVHYKEGRIYLVNGSVSTAPFEEVIPGISIDRARDRAFDAMGAEQYMFEDPGMEELAKEVNARSGGTFYPLGELVYCLVGEGDKSTFAPCYKFDVFAARPYAREYIYIHANTGEVVKRVDLIRHTDTPGTADTRYHGNRNITGDSYSGGFLLRESGRNIRTLNMLHSSYYSLAVNFSDNNNSWTAAEHHNAAKDDAGLDAHWASEVYYDFLLNDFGRNSIDGAGGLLLHYVNTDLTGLGFWDSDNAFWNGFFMTYGEGTSYDPLTTLDVVGHEVTHGLTENTANLDYEKEPGALNESFIDIFGTYTEYKALGGSMNWTIGEDVSFILRNMSDPNAYGDPDTYQGTYYVPTSSCTPSSGNDFCGVHTNSGVQNFWFYLLSQGGTGTNDIGDPYSVSGIGIESAAAIAFRCLTVYLTVNSGYADARSGAIAAAIDLFGECSNEMIQTANAWNAVGVGGTTPLVNYVCGTITGTPALYAAMNLIETGTSCPAPYETHLVTSSPQVTFRSGEAIMLRPGFLAPATSKLYAYISPCGSFVNYKVGNEAVQNDRLTGIEQSEEVGIFPNPAGHDDLLNLRFNMSSENRLTIGIFSTAGQLVRTERLTVPKGASSHVLSHEQLPAGTYILQVSGTGINSVKKLVISY